MDGDPGDQRRASLRASDADREMSGRDYFWPVWPILGFMLLLGWQTFYVYVWYSPARFDDDRSRRRSR